MEEENESSLLSKYIWKAAKHEPEIDRIVQIKQKPDYAALFDHIGYISSNQRCFKRKEES